MINDNNNNYNRLVKLLQYVEDKELDMIGCTLITYPSACLSVPPVVIYDI